MSNGGAVFDEKKQRVIAGVIEDTIAQEFIAESVIGACLPCSIIFGEEGRKYGLRSDLMCGKIGYGTNITIPLHFWNEVDGQIFDPTRTITQTWEPDFKFNNLKYYQGEQILHSIEDLLMMQVYMHFKITHLTGEYFSLASNQLSEIRTRIQKRLDKLLSKYKI